MPQLRTEPYAILVADMVGYSQRLAQQPVGTHAAFRGHLHDVFEPTVGDHNGRVVKTTGDGIVAVFADAGQAEHCGREIQLQLQRQTDREPSFAPIKYRIAAHYGSIVVESRDIFGLDVNIAIHMQALAPAGGVCVSGALFDLLSEQSREPYRYLGKKYLKNIPNSGHGPYLRPGPRRRPVGRYPTTDCRSPDAAISALPQGSASRSSRSWPGRPRNSVLANIAHDSLTSGLSRFADAFTVVPIGATIRQIAAERAKSREFLSNEMACEYLLHGSCVIGPAMLELMVHLESLVKKEVLWSGKVRIALDQQQLDSIDKVIAAELVAPVVLYLERSESYLMGRGRTVGERAPLSPGEAAHRAANPRITEGSPASAVRDHHALRGGRRRVYRACARRAQLRPPSGRPAVRRVGRACPGVCQEGDRGRRPEPERACRARSSGIVPEATEQRCRDLSARLETEPIRPDATRRLGGLSGQYGAGAARPRRSWRRSSPAGHEIERGSNGAFATPTGRSVGPTASSPYWIDIQISPMCIAIWPHPTPSSAE